MIGRRSAKASEGPAVTVKRAPRGGNRAVSMPQRPTRASETGARPVSTRPKASPLIAVRVSHFAHAVVVHAKRKERPHGLSLAWPRGGSLPQVGVIAPPRRSRTTWSRVSCGRTGMSKQYAWRTRGHCPRAHMSPPGGPCPLAVGWCCKSSPGEERVPGEVHLGDQPLRERPAEKRRVECARAASVLMVLPRIRPGLDCRELLSPR